MPDSSRPRTRRRTLLRTAAWSVPVVSMVAPAPAFAVSQCVGAGLCPSIGFGAPSGTANTNGMNGGGFPSAGNGWSASATAGWGNSNTVGFIVNGASSSFAATAEPTTSGRTITLTQVGQPALKTGCFYQVKFGIIQYIGNSGVLTLSVVVGASAYQIYTTSGQPVTYSNVDKGIQTYTLPTTVSGALSFRFNFAGAGDADDLTIYSPSLTCANTT